MYASTKETHNVCPSVGCVHVLKYDNDIITSDGGQGLYKENGQMLNLSNI